MALSIAKVANYLAQVDNARAVVGRDAVRRLSWRQLRPDASFVAVP